MSNSHGPSGREALQSLRRGAALLVCVFATIVAPAQAAGTAVVVRSASLSLPDGDGVYELDARTEIRLPDDARKAIEAGLTLGLEYQIELSRVRSYLPDATVAALEQDYELSYHALSQRYLVRNLNTGEQQDYGSFQAAIEGLGDVRDLPVIDADLVEEGPAYEARIRAIVDLDTTPDALGWLLFWADDWSATSEWYTWPLRP